AIVAIPTAPPVPMRIVISIWRTSPSVPLGAAGGKTKAPGGGVAKAPGGGVAKNSGGGVGRTMPGGGVDPKLKENDPPELNVPVSAQSVPSSWKRCSTLGTNGSSTTKAHPPSTPTSNPASVGSGAGVPVRAVLNPAAAAIARKMTSGESINSPIESGPMRHTSAGDGQLIARLAASVQANAMMPAIRPYRAQAGIRAMRPAALPDIPRLPGAEASASPSWRPNGSC